MLKNQYVFHQNRSESSTFDENPCRFLRKCKKVEKTITFFIKIDEKVALLMKILDVFYEKHKKVEKTITFFIKIDEKVALLMKILVVF